MAEIILYLTRSDAQIVVSWLDAEDAIAWLLRVERTGTTSRWKAVGELERLESGRYWLWRTGVGSPSFDPFAGWSQTWDSTWEESPKLGTSQAEIYRFVFREHGREAENSIGRSGFSWIGNHYAASGSRAPPECAKWWQRLKRFVRANATAIPWGSGRVRAYAFAEAHRQILEGRPVDTNPS